MRARPIPEFVLFLLACGYPSYYPHAEYLPAESASPVSCAAPTGTPVELYVVDQSAFELSLYALDEGCAETWVTGLVEGQPWHQPSEVGAAFVVRQQSGALVESLVVPEGDNTYTWTVR